MTQMNENAIGDAWANLGKFSGNQANPFNNAFAESSGPVKKEWETIWDAFAEKVMENPEIAAIDKELATLQAKREAMVKNSEESRIQTRRELLNMDLSQALADGLKKTVTQAVVIDLEPNVTVVPETAPVIMTPVPESVSRKAFGGGFEIDPPGSHNAMEIDVIQPKAQRIDKNYGDFIVFKTNLPATFVAEMLEANNSPHANDSVALRALLVSKDATYGDYFDQFQNVMKTPGFMSEYMKWMSDSVTPDKEQDTAMTAAARNIPVQRQRRNHLPVKNRSR